MLIIQSWLDSHPWKINEKDFEIHFDENELKLLALKCIRDELDEKFYHPNLGIHLTQNISKNIRREFAKKYKVYKIIVQTFVGKMSNENLDKLYASYYFNQKTDKCFVITENNGQM